MFFIGIESEVLCVVDMIFTRHVPAFAKFSVFFKTLHVYGKLIPIYQLNPIFLIQQLN